MINVVISKYFLTNTKCHGHVGINIQQCYTYRFPFLFTLAGIQVHRKSEFLLHDINLHVTFKHDFFFLTRRYRFSMIDVMRYI